MPTPPEILAVPRPKNTIVVAYGKNKDRYAVRARIGCERKNGGNYPVNGPIIGHIIDGKYIPKEEKKESNISRGEIDIKDWALAIEVDKVCQSLLSELKKVYSTHDALKLYCICLLRVMYPDVKDYELKDYYESSYLSILYPEVGLSRNTVSKFLKDLGKTYSRIVRFMRNRVETLGIDTHLLIDGTLKTCHSKVSSLSEFSRKSRIRGSRDLSILYCFNLDKMEPVVSKCYPGNMLDSTAYSDFIEEFKIESGFIVGDKAFTRKAAGEYLRSHPGLHILYPLRRNASQIKTYGMYEFDHLLPGFEGVTYKKVACRDGTFLYSFRDSARAAKEEQDWLRRAQKNGTYSFEELEKKRLTFGTIVLDSDLDLKPKTAYQAYMDRWIIEIVMRYYKNALSFDDTREHSDLSIIGSEFIDFLAVICTFNLLKDFDNRGLLDKHTYKYLLKVLAKAKKVQVTDGEWLLVKLNPAHEKILMDLDLLPKPKVEKKKRGRPKGSKNRKIKESVFKENPTPVKRKRGRPKGSKNKPK